jgi:hypothetical protein
VFCLRTERRRAHLHSLAQPANYRDLQGLQVHAFPDIIDELANSARLRNYRESDRLQSPIFPYPIGQSTNRRIG